MKRRMTIWAFLAGLPALALADGPRVNWNADPMAGFRQSLAERGTRLSGPEKGRTAHWGKERVDASGRSPEGGAVEGAPIQLVHDRGHHGQGRARGQDPFHRRSGVGRQHYGPHSGLHWDNRNGWHFGPHWGPHGPGGHLNRPYGLHYYSPYRYQDPFHRYSSPYRWHYGPHNGLHYDPFNGLHFGPHWGPHRRH